MNSPVFKNYYSLSISDRSEQLKFIYSEKATNICEISTLLLSYVTWNKSKVEISQNFVAFSEYMNFNFQTDVTSDIYLPIDGLRIVTVLEFIFQYVQRN